MIRIPNMELPILNKVGDLNIVSHIGIVSSIGYNAK
jgi:hypothetical protein